MQLIQLYLGRMCIFYVRLSVPSMQLGDIHVPLIVNALMGNILTQSRPITIACEYGAV